MHRAQLLADMHVIVASAELTTAAEPCYPRISEAGGRSPLPLKRMLRVYSLQLARGWQSQNVLRALLAKTSARARSERSEIANDPRWVGLGIASPIIEPTGRPGVEQATRLWALEGTLSEGRRAPRTTPDIFRYHGRCAIRREFPIERIIVFAKISWI